MQPQLSNSCCFSGHRPDKLPPEQSPEGQRLRALLREMVRSKLREGCTHFYCGMARGADLYFAEAVLDLRERRSGVTLEAARPCESQASRWPQEEQRRYQRILERCDYETLVQHQYDRWCMMRRNRYMVDRSARLLAVYDGVPKGGTAQTLAYALRKGLAVTILPPV